MNYERSNLDELAVAFPELSTYAALSAWNQRAKEEADKIDAAIASINEELQPFNQQIADLSLELNRTKAQQSLLKRLFGNHSAEKAREAQIAALQRGASSAQAEAAQLRVMKVQLAKIIEYAAEFGPKTPAEKNLLIKKLRQQKKELQVRKREITAGMTAVRQEARAQSVNAGKRGLFGVTGSFGDGALSDRLGWYDRSLAEDQRRAIRHVKEETLRPHEAEKAKLEQQLIDLDKRLLWIEQFQAVAPQATAQPLPPSVTGTRATAEPAEVNYKTTCTHCGVHIEHAAFNGWADCPKCGRRVDLSIVDAA